MAIDRKWRRARPPDDARIPLNGEVRSRGSGVRSRRIEARPLLPRSLRTPDPRRPTREAYNGQPLDVRLVQESQVGPPRPQDGARVRLQPVGEDGAVIGA